MPESPRWLFAIGHNDKALGVLREAAKANKINPDQMNERFEGLSSLSKATTKPKVSVLFTKRTLRIRTILLTTKW